MDFAPRFATLTQCLVERGQFLDAPLSLIDVGCGGGLAPLWRRFEPSLTAVGIDPQTTECERLQAAETNPAVHYLPRFLRLPESHPFRQQRGDREPWTGNPWERTSSAHAMAKLAAQTAPEKQFSELNAWPTEKLVEPTRTSTLDELAAELNLREVDFVKIDTDGPDLEVLHSGEKLLRDGPALGCALEVNFSGSADPTDHSFHNMDRLMRSWGFDLFDLSVRRCSLAALPMPFQYDNAPHYTDHGRVLQGDALYLRDPCGWDRNPGARVELSPIRLLKLACLFELFGSPDHAAELLRDHAAPLAELTDVEPLLHLLAHEIDPRYENYHQFIQRFKDDPTSFYPSKFRA
ncbi:FkbM family methyltransferase [Actomonas aquatica]|uniref:FkbM family methyltransferase n=1 Tax=Actomonas aquatica TaxID=2866162 RepID=A0ABZ1C7L6_9BACT|nr:FkbM family methyltransferase [Opitutus sp. WL0086]WRQ87380.1 FkbM family methyltransferase [Opitutus sp. WL0086]